MGSGRTSFWRGTHRHAGARRQLWSSRIHSQSEWLPGAGPFLLVHCCPSPREPPACPRKTRCYCLRYDPYTLGPNRLKSSAHCSKPNDPDDSRTSGRWVRGPGVPDRTALTVRARTPPLGETRHGYPCETVAWGLSQTGHVRRWHRTIDLPL